MENTITDKSALYPALKNVLAITNESEELVIAFKELVITCDGKTTSVMVDGEEMGKKCTAIIFKHSVVENKNIISLVKEVRLEPEQ
jgi:hypothetical protein